jgi:hypothetical protein
MRKFNSVFIFMACTMLLSIPIVYAADQPYMGGQLAS